MPGLIGARIPRLEDRPLLIGRGRFVDDIALPGLLHAAFVRSPHPHALIRGVDAAAVRARCRRARRAHARRSRAGDGPAADAAPFQFGDPARPAVVVRARRRRGVLCGRDRRHRGRRRPLRRRGRGRAGRGRLRAAARGRRLPPGRGAGRAGGAARAQQQHRLDLQGRLWRRRRGLRQGGSRLPRGALAAPRRRPSDRRPRPDRRVSAATAAA